MAYDSDFFEAYEQYLSESSVRRSHDKAFQHFYEWCTTPGMRRPLHRNVIDFGCGVGEYHRFGPHDSYVGLDRKVWKKGPFIEVDYLKDDWRETLNSIGGYTPNAFVSLFSIEACLPASERYAFYAKTFQENPEIQYALVSGFYYRGRRSEETVSEEGGIVSYQTRESPGDYPCDGFEEQWLVLATPSKMFGPDVVEVWKFLSRDKP